MSMLDWTVMVSQPRNGAKKEMPSINRLKKNDGQLLNKMDLQWGRNYRWDRMEYLMQPGNTRIPVSNGGYRKGGPVMGGAWEMITCTAAPLSESYDSEDREDSKSPYRTTKRDWGFDRFSWHMIRRDCNKAKESLRGQRPLKWNGLRMLSRFLLEMSYKLVHTGKEGIEAPISFLVVEEIINIVQQCDLNALLVLKVCKLPIPTVWQTCFPSNW